MQLKWISGSSVSWRISRSSLAEKGVGEGDLSIFEAVNDAILSCAARATETGRYQLNDVEYAAFATILTLHDVQLVLLCHIISCAFYCRTGREPSLHEPLSKQDAQRSNGIRDVALSALDCPGGCNPREGQAARVQGNFFYHVRLIAF